MHRRSRDCDPTQFQGDPVDPSTVDMETPVYWYEGECLACGMVLPLTDRDLCTACDASFNRDLIRLRQWSLSSLAEEIPLEWESLRQQVIDQHGEALELLMSETLGLVQDDES